MKKSLLLLILIASIYTLQAQEGELKEAFDYLNEVRSNPSQYSKEISVNLSDIEPRPALVWNDTLAEVAYEKAKDMATNNYFSHTDKEGNGINIKIYNAGYKIPVEWTTPASSNYFESISAGNSTPKQAIINLINDNSEKKHEKAGHRMHLLGITDFYDNLVDIGIGFYYDPNGQYKYYVSVIIAKHNF
ncbi:MAG: CAP domain-containing protein [Bacteroidales bacterium]|nr:CAP domain-containing protein [Bacteroidales bacterium]